MPLDKVLLDILACPEDKGPLWYVTDDGAEEYLYNPRLRRRYAVREGIPVMLVSESTAVDEAEHARVTALIAERGIEPTFAT